MTRAAKCQVQCQDDDDEHEDMDLNDDDNQFNNNHLHENDADESVESSVFDVGKDADITELSGTYKQIIEINHRGRRHIKTKWKWQAKERTSTATNDLVHATISDYHVKNCSKHGLVKTATIDIECYTTAVINGHRFRCAADYRGHKWYDWVMLCFPKTIDSAGGSVCIGRIMGIFRYMSAGMMTMGMMEIKGYHVDDVLNSYTVDETVYMVVHCSDDELSMRDIHNNVVAPFSVTELSQLYILPVTAIQGPAIVVPDFITENELSNTDFFAVCPRRMLGHYFRRYCREEDEDYAVDLDRSDRFDSDNEEFIYEEVDGGSQGGSSEEVGYFDDIDGESDDDDESGSVNEEDNGPEPYGDDESEHWGEGLHDFDVGADDESEEVYYDSSEDEHGNRIMHI